jgi:hypothetical protein
MTADRVKLEVSRIELEAARRRLATELGRLRELEVKAGASGTFALADRPAGDLPGTVPEAG